MAHVYFRSGAGGSNNGTSWANAYTSVTSASGKAAGDQLWVSEDHAESSAVRTEVTFPGTQANPNTFICVDHAGSVPPVPADFRTTATITVTASDFRTGGSFYARGISFSASAGIHIGALSSDAWAAIFDSCSLAKTGGSGTGQALIFGDGNGSRMALVTLDNTPLKIGHIDDVIYVAGYCVFNWRNCASPLGAFIPTLLMQGGATVTVEALDLSPMGSGKYLFYAGNHIGAPVIFKNVKLGAGVSAVNPGPKGPSAVYLINCDSGATNYRHEKHSAYGDQTIDTTVVRTGGASVGGTPIAWKIIPTSNASRITPFEAMTIAVPNNSIGVSRTLTIYGTWGGGAVPTSADLYPIVSYMGSSATPIATITSFGPADIFATGSNWTADGSTWGGGTTPFKMVVTLSSPQPAMIGDIDVKIMAVSANTFYIDPKIVKS